MFVEDIVEGACTFHNKQVKVNLSLGCVLHVGGFNDLFIFNQN
jgi:hypothetical protein